MVFAGPGWQRGRTSPAPIVNINFSQSFKGTQFMKVSRKYGLLPFCFSVGLCGCQLEHTPSSQTNSEEAPKTMAISTGCSHHSTQIAVTSTEDKITVASGTYAQGEEMVFDLENLQIIKTTRDLQGTLTKVTLTKTNPAAYNAAIDKAAQNVSLLLKGNGCTAPNPGANEMLAAINSMKSRWFCVGEQIARFDLDSSTKTVRMKTNNGVTETGTLTSLVPGQSWWMEFAATEWSCAVQQKDEPTLVSCGATMGHAEIALKCTGF